MSITGGTERTVEAVPEAVQRFRSELVARQPEELARVTESRAARDARRDARLRALVVHARRHSSWHRARLARVDVEHLRGDDLTILPTMTKHDVMANWDDIACDPQLTLERVNAHLDVMAETGPALLGERYLPVTTGGSTGTRGVFVWDLNDLGVHMAATGRNSTWNAARRGPPARPMVRAAVWGANAVHLGRTLAWLNGMVIRSAGTPVPELVAWLNGLQPDLLGAYSSVLGRLAEEARAGRLQIAPSVVSAVAEPVDDRLHRVVREAWGSGLTNVYSLTECPGIAVSFPGRAPLTLADDVAVIEVVDAEGRPVPPGQEGEKILLSVLTNSTLPLLRYEVTDQLALLPSGADDRPWTGQLLSPPAGRADDWFRWADRTELHPHVVRSVLAQTPAIIEYQVHQTAVGIDVTLVASAAVDTDELARRLEAELCSTGIAVPVVNVRNAASLPRHADSAKLRRFIPLPADADPSPDPTTIVPAASVTLL